MTGSAFGPDAESTGLGVTVTDVVESGFCSGDLDPNVKDFCPNEKPALPVDPNSVDELELPPTFSVFSLSSATVSGFSPLVEGVPNEKPELFTPPKLNPLFSELVFSSFDEVPNENPLFAPPPKLKPPDSEEPVVVEADVPKGNPEVEVTAGFVGAAVT